MPPYRRSKGGFLAFLDNILPPETLLMREVRPVASMKPFRFRQAFLAATASIALHSAYAAPADFNEVGRQVAIMLQNGHFARLPFNEATSELFLDSYLKQLDPSKVYFTQQDVDRIRAQYGKQLFDLLIQGESLNAANDIYAIFKTRVATRGKMAQDLLKNDPLDFRKDESMASDRKDAPWPKDDAEADKLLCQQLKGAVLSEIITRELQVRMAKDQGKPDPTQNEMPPREKVSSRYERYLHTVADAAQDEIADGLLGAVAHSYDPHTDFMISREAKRFNDDMRNELVGIGAQLVPEDDGTTRITGISIGGPADREGHLQLQDRVLAVDAQNSGTFTDIKFMDRNKVVDLIRGPNNSTIRLKVQPAAAPPGETKVVSIVRGKVEVKDAQASARLISSKGTDTPERRVGWIILPSFYADFATGKIRCSDDIRQLLQRLTAEKVDGIVFDVRNNGGGSLEEVRRITGFFVDSGPVVQVKDTLGRIETLQTDRSKPLYDGPLVVLINKASASASEILAGALQDHNRAVIVGDSSSYGKGTVQRTKEISEMLPFLAARDDAGMLKLTIQKFYRPSGVSTQLDGVSSDVVLPSSLDAVPHLEIGERFLDRAFPNDRIRVAPGLTPLNRDNLHVAFLKERSEARVKADKDFGYISDDVQRTKEQREKNSVSLNIDQRRKELSDLYDLQQQRNVERRERFKTIETEDAKAYTFTKLTLADLANGTGFHPYDPSKENEEYIRRAKDPIEELNNTPKWPNGLDPVIREGIKVVSDLIDAAEKSRVAEVTPQKTLQAQ